MNEPAWLSDEERRAWMSLVAVTTVLPAALDTDLNSKGKLSFFDYTVLAMLSESEGRFLPMSELAAQTSSSLSRLSHVISKMELRGWVERQPHPTDARVKVAHMTEEGFATIQRLAPGHVATVRALMFDALDEKDINDLARVSSKIVRHMAPDSWLFRKETRTE